jgi:purine-binding chemotaxis protein CheW
MDDLLGEFLTEIGESLSSLDVEQVKFERNPPPLDPLWREFSNGIYRLADKLLVVLDLPRLLDFTKPQQP